MILANPTIAGAVRQLFANWMGLPAGRYRVRLFENFYVPAADGLPLATDRYEPAGVAVGPTILMRTPYSKGAAGSLVAGLFAYQFATHGYHVVVQDCRGRFGSQDGAGGEFIPFLHEADDGAATLEWIAQQTWSDGQVGMWGASYLGYCQWAAAAGGSPYLKALAPMLTSSRLMSYPANGFPLDLLLRWMFQMQTMDTPNLSMFERMQRINDAVVQDRYLRSAFDHLPILTADELAIGHPGALYREMAEADASHEYWHASDHSAAVASAPPADFTSGWYDLFLDGLLADYTAQLKAAQAPGKPKPYLTIGPWHHLDTGYLPVAFTDGLAWFSAYLRGDRSKLRKRPVRLFVMGARRWRSFESWPPPSKEYKLYLHGSGAQKTGRLRWQPVDAGETAAGGANALPDQYRYNPALPTPNLGGAKMGTDAGQVDNRPLEERADVLIYTTPPLPGDVEIIGCVHADLYVRSSLPYTDFFVRLCDVESSGRSLNVCDGNFRIEPGRGELQPDGSLRVTVAMSATAYRFLTNHRIRVQVSSGAHPRYARNLGVPEPQVMSTTYQLADQTVYHDAIHPSAVALPLVTV
ncbi:MAG: CocE/NonD family hydrolase [Caldilineaceae bacterium]